MSLVWQSPKQEENSLFFDKNVRKFGGFPRQCEHWLGMTLLFLAVSAPPEGEPSGLAINKTDDGISLRRLFAYAVAAAFSGRIGASVEMACL